MSEKEMLIKELLKKQALCPGCDSKIEEKSIGEVFLYKSETYEVKYLICKNCLKKVNKIRESKKITFFKKIEVKLDTNFRLYTAIKEDLVIDNIAGKIKEPGAISVLPVDNDWNDDDRDYFLKNKNKQYRARKIFPGELEETYKENSNLKKSAQDDNIKFAIVHQITEGQRVRSYVSDLTGHPYEDEDFVAALFQILMNDLLTIEDLDELYKEIKRRNSFVKEAVEAYEKTKE